MKPTLDDTRFAVTAGGAESSIPQEPTPDLKDDGYTTDAVPTSRNFSWMFRKIHAWFQWLTQFWDDDDNMTLPEGLVVSGQAQFIGNVVAESGLTALILHQTQDEVIPLHISGSTTESPAATYSNGRWTFTATASHIDTPMSGLRVGDIIKSFRVFGSKASGAGQVFECELVERSTTGVKNVLANPNNATNAPGAITVSATLGTPHTVAAGSTYHISTNAISGDSIVGAEYTRTR